jgi:hypothetical protein
MTSPRRLVNCFKRLFSGGFIFCFLIYLFMSYSCFFNWWIFQIEIPNICLSIVVYVDLTGVTMKSSLFRVKEYSKQTASKRTTGTLHELLFDTEDGGNTFLLNAGELLPECMASHARLCYSLLLPSFYYLPRKISALKFSGPICLFHYNFLTEFCMNSSAISCMLILCLSHPDLFKYSDNKLM